MFDRLRRKWKLTGPQLALVLCTFALGGSLTGFVGRRLMNLFPIEENWLWVVVYILVVTLLWPLSVLLVSILFGQYRFFSGYLRKMGQRMRIIGNGGTEKKTTAIDTIPRPKGEVVQLAIFASGAGSNAQRIIDHFRYSRKVKVALIVCNKPDAGVLDIAAREHIPVLLIDKDSFFRDGYVDVLNEKNIDLIVLAGFLWKLPASLIDAFPSRIINIHPALLPKYGGKGMYGAFVHEMVLQNRDKESGITIHYVDELYDHGRIIYQATCPVLQSDTPQSLAERIHKLEHEHYPRIVEQIIAKMNNKAKDSR